MGHGYMMKLPEYGHTRKRATVPSTGKLCGILLSHGVSCLFDHIRPERDVAAPPQAFPITFARPPPRHGLRTSAGDARPVTGEGHPGHQ